MSILIVVVGTGTDVGKTFVACSLARALRSLGASVGAWKPVASGCVGPGEDAIALATALGAPVLPPLHTFAAPISAHLAARFAGARIDLDAIRERAAALTSAHDVFILETAGGLFSPLREDATNLDLVRALAPARVLLVAPDRIGVLHDVAATSIAARSCGLGFDAVALSAPATPDASTGTNAAELAATLGVTIATTFPRAALDGAETHASALLVAAALGVGRADLRKPA